MNDRPRARTTSLTVVILTLNEEVHITRAIGSVRAIADRIVVVDSGSSDRTTALAEGLGAEVMSHHWVNPALQFNWALTQLPPDTKWVLRLDADEVVTPALAEEISTRLSSVGEDVDGVFVSRRIKFLGRPIQYGGLFPIRVLRLFRYSRARCENRWMDEHIKTEGKTLAFKGEILDDNLNSLTFWIQKHNTYASREVVDILNFEHGFLPYETVASLRRSQHPGLKRWLKEKIYGRLPAGSRAFAYFFYRYILRLGFLDGREGMAFHVLQGLWYRFLVDAKLIEVRKYMRDKDVDAVTAIDQVLGIKVR